MGNGLEGCFAAGHGDKNRALNRAAHETRRPPRLRPFCACCHGCGDIVVAGFDCESGQHGDRCGVPFAVGGTAGGSSRVGRHGADGRGDQAGGRYGGKSSRRFMAWIAAHPAGIRCGLGLLEQKLAGANGHGEQRQQFLPRAYARFGIRARHRALDNLGTRGRRIRLLSQPGLHAKWDGFESQSLQWHHVDWNRSLGAAACFRPRWLGVFRQRPKRAGRWCLDAISRRGGGELQLPDQRVPHHGRLRILQFAAEPIRIGWD